MATGDMVARLLLDGKEFEQSLKKAKKGVRDFEASTKKAGKSTGDMQKGVTNMLSTIGKIATAVGVASSAAGVFNQAIGSSQTLTDKWGRIVQSAKTVWDNFLYSLTSGDWSAFIAGLDEMIEKAKQLYDAVDKLANVKMSVGFVSNQSQYQARQYMLTARNKELPIEQRREALQLARAEAKTIGEAAEVQKAAALDFIKKLIASKSDLSADVIWESSIIRAFETDASEFGDVERKLFSEAEDYYATQATGFATLRDTAIEEIKRKIRERGPTGKNGRSMSDIAAALKGEAWKNYATQEELDAIDEIEQRYKEAIYSLQLSAQQMLVPYIALERLSDKELANMMQEYMDAENVLRGLIELQQTQQELGIALNKEEAAAIAEKTREAEKYAEVLKSMPWDTAAAGEMRLNAALTGGFTAENIARMGGTPGLRSSLDLGVPGLPEYGGEYGFWKFNKNTIKSSGALEAMGVQTFDWEAMQQMIRDEELMQWAAKNREEFDKWGASIDLLGGAFKSLGDSIGGTTGQLLSFIGGLVDAAQQMLPLIAQIMAEKAAREANASAAATEAAAKSMSAYAGIPFAGIGLGLAAVAAVVGAIQSVPKFAEGGIVTSATLGVFGEAGPEAVMPLDRLEEFITGRDVRVTGNIKASGKELVVVLDNYNRVRNG